MGLKDAVLSSSLELVNTVKNMPVSLLIGVVVLFAVVSSLSAYLVLSIIAPVPRPPRASEKHYTYILPNGQVSSPEPLPCWHDRYMSQRHAQLPKPAAQDSGVKLEESEVFMSVIVPAYNEEERMTGMLEEAVGFLQQQYDGPQNAANGDAVGTGKSIRKDSIRHRGQEASEQLGNGNRRRSGRTGWEILIVSDGSTDGTIDTAYKFARNHQNLQFSTLNAEGKRMAPIAPGSVRVVSLEKNRGKGGAVTHGMRHVRGEYAIFADADGASRFSDLGKLVKECQQIEDAAGRGVAVGSRAHLVGSEAVVKRSFVRNLLMHFFHFFLRVLTPPATAAIKDTQCGFKLFSRAALPYIIPYMHSEGWIFDVEMLMLAESANIPVAEVAIDWREVKGSKLNVLWDSLGMAYGLALLRAAWGLGVYRRS